MATSGFWDKFGPGLFQFGVDYAGERLQGRDREKLLQRAQGPLFQQQQNLAGRSLALAGSMDPKAMAAERFAEQQKLLEPGRQAEINDLMRRLQATGMLGVSSFESVPGAPLPAGVSANPYFAALLAAQEGAKAKSAFDSLREGEGYLDQLVNRGGRLSSQARGSQGSGIEAVNAGLMSRKPSIGGTLLGSLSNVLRDPKGARSIWDTIKSIPGMFGGGTSTRPVYSGYNPQPGYTASLPASNYGISSDEYWMGY